MVTSYAYDAFGQVAMSGEASDNPIQYDGRENDGTGLYYYRARYYSTELQRFISEDPIGFEGEDINFYTYTWDNPLNYIDPFGTTALSINPPPKPPPPPPRATRQTVATKATDETAKTTGYGLRSDVSNLYGILRRTLSRRSNW